jgi:hypothetical protein
MTQQEVMQYNNRMQNVLVGNSSNDISNYTFTDSSFVEYS